MAEQNGTGPPNPLDPAQELQKPPPGVVTTEPTHPPQPILPGDSAVTRAEKVERHGHPDASPGTANGDFQESPAKRIKLETNGSSEVRSDERKKGVAPIKPEYLLHVTDTRVSRASNGAADDKAEASGRAHDSRGDNRESGGKRKGKNQGGQNSSRKFGSWKDTLQLCGTRTIQPEFSPAECKFGKGCKFEHDLRKYLAEGKLDDLKTFDGLCPIWDSLGRCPAGWKCRFVGSHSEEKEHEDGRKELVLTEDPERKAKAEARGITADEPGVFNVVSAQAKIDLQRKRTKLPKSDKYLPWLDKREKELHIERNAMQPDEADGDNDSAMKDNRATYVEPPLKPSEKRRLYYGPETPVLAPLTTQGNLPFRRLCIGLGAQVTWSEMAMGLPLIQGARSEWALMKAHESEISPPKVENKNTVVEGYDHAKDLKFGAQIAANKPWVAIKTTEVLSDLCPRLRAIDLNCGCPIDLVYNSGAGSALLDAQGRLLRMLTGMNAVSGEIPITAKIRMGTKDGKPNADKLIKRLTQGSPDGSEGPAGVAAITLHGRSRAQRYTRSADWSYISECAALIKRLQERDDEKADTVQEADPRDLANSGKVYFLGNGDCYSHEDYNRHLEEARVDSVMIGRGALIKPWIFEEIEAGQHLDKSASERLSYVEKFTRYGLETWGSDEVGVGTTRRFLLEWLSFAYRYVPVGILEHLPPSIQDRPPAYKGRNELETLLSSDNYKDWIKIRYVSSTPLMTAEG